MSRRIDEVRACWWCHDDFPATRADEVYCSSPCGYHARGLDKYGRPVCREILTIWRSVA